MPGTSSSSGCAAMSRYAVVPAPATQLRQVRAGGDGDQPEQGQRDPDHHTGQHTDQQRGHDGGDRDPEVEPLDPRQPAHLGDVHHAHHDGLDDQGGQHRLGQTGEQRRQEQQREQHGDAGDDGGQPGPGPGMVVERARRQAGGHRHALEQTGPGVGEGLRHRLLVDVDLVPVLRCEGPSVPGGLGEADQQQRHGCCQHRVQVRQEQAGIGDAQSGQPTGDVADDRDATLSQPEDPVGQQPADDEHQGARNPWGDPPQSEDHHQGDDADHRRQSVCRGQRRRARTTAPAAR